MTQKCPQCFTDEPCMCGLLVGSSVNLTAQPEPTITLTRSTLLRMHRSLEQLHQLVYFSDDVDQRIKSAVGDRLWNLEALIESAGFTLDHGQIRDQ